MDKTPKNNMFLRQDQVNQSNVWKRRQLMQYWEGLLRKTSLVCLDEKKYCDDIKRKIAGVFFHFIRISSKGKFVSYMT